MGRLIIFSRAALSIFHLPFHRMLNCYMKVGELMDCVNFLSVAGKEVYSCNTGLIDCLLGGSGVEYLRAMEVVKLQH